MSEASGMLIIKASNRTVLDKFMTTENEVPWALMAELFSCAGINLCESSKKAFLPIGQSFKFKALQSVQGFVKIGIHDES
jgi:hypothetical protein